MVNVTNGKLIRLLVEDEPFDVRYGDGAQARAGARLPRRRAAPRGGVGVPHRTRRSACARRGWSPSPSARWPPSSTRSRPSSGEFPVVVQSELVANEEGPAASSDPRAAAALASPLESDMYAAVDLRAILVHRTRTSGLRMAAAMDHVVEGPDGDHDRLRGLPRPRAGHRHRRPRRRASRCGSSSSSPTAGRRSARSRRCATRCRPRGHGAVHAGWDGLLGQQRSYLDEFWERSDVELEGDAELQQAIRFGLFHTLQAGARGEQRAIAAKGLTGPGYDGHTFWDTEMFVLPVLTYTAPHASADALRWRTPDARSGPRAGQDARPEGRRVPVADDPRRGVLELLAGRDRGVSHQRRHRRRGHPLPGGRPTTTSSSTTSASSCWSRRRGCGARSVTTTPPGDFRIDGVTGPDEYSAVADNNVYTNLMAQRNLRAAADAVERHPAPRRRAGRRRRGDGELARRRRQDGRSPTTRRSRSTPRPRASPTTSAGTSSHARPSSTRCCCTSPTSTCTASRWSSRPTWCSRCSCAATPSPPRRRRATSSTTRRSPSATRRCRRAPRRWSPPRSATSTWPTTTSPRRR